MLFKLIKHDFKYSAKLFLILGAIAIALSIILGFYDALYQGHRIAFMGQEQSLIFGPIWSMGMLFNFALIPSFVAAIIHIGQFYRKSMFGKVGHLLMTIPISRIALLLSKIAVSFVWFLYSILIAIAMVYIIHTISPFLTTDELIGLLSADFLVFILYTTTIALAAIALLFFCITLSHSVFVGVRLNGLLSGLIGFLYAGLYIYIIGRLQSRFRADMELVMEYDGIIWDRVVGNMPLTGLRYGRIVIGRQPFGLPGPELYSEVYIDIYVIILTIAVTAIAIAATHSLLKNRVSL